MAQQQPKTKSQLSKEGDRKLANDAGRTPKSGGEAKKAAARQPAARKPGQPANPRTGIRSVDR